MKTNDLDQMFASAREIPIETAPDQVAGWISIAAATSSGSLGIAGKLKLLIAKKIFVIMGTILSVASIGVIVTMSMNSVEAQKDAPIHKKSTSVVQIDAPKKKETKQTATLKIEKEAPKPITAAKVLEPIAPTKTETFHKVSNAPQAMKPLKSINVNDRSSKVRFAPAPKTSNEFITDDFTKIKMSGLANIVLVQGSECKVSFDINPNMEEEFLLNSSGGVLNIDFDDEVFAKKSDRTVYVTFKNLEELILSGVGDIETKGIINLESLTCKVSGVGDVSLNVNCDNLEVKFSGVGDINVEGKGNSAKYAWSGVGDLQASNMKSRDVVLSLSGMGDAKLHATETLEVNLTGFGDVKYTGSPKSTDLNSPGNGKIKGS